MTISGIVVTYNPPAEFMDHLEVWMSQVDQLLLVDDGSTPEWREHACRSIKEKYKRVDFLFNQGNLGIAASLNRGFVRLMEEHQDLAFVFDQDSLPSPGMVAAILDVHQNHPDRSRIAIVAPNIIIPSANNSFSFLQPRGRFSYKRIRCADQQSLEDVSIVITSGAMYNLDAYRQIGPFREDFFIDYVDTEYCLRARQQGYKIVVACRAQLRHRLGSQIEKRFGPITMHPTFHSPARWYYINRNRIRMIRTYALVFPHWLLYDFRANVNGLARLVLFEDRKMVKILAMAWGAWDGLTNRMGPISPERRSLFLRNASDG